ncbi:hypothetical protein SAMN02745704_00607 [Paucidesulfovibrio gracilis DSM 16080]|jgi:hemolysin activation/secretion protein|uniref:Uncharacterized protein n=1 Tax=Paucidesulfovibrio gracilis DSM 16080 TaxID=1121449 RepID=A0A1T4WB42_9BACT|nr:hypothetical protein [Paucidesulfovibrio gracilis]SKA74165.1 hypothetical protein SAMN02745704_00607 [Paucidesulfovibrio gracilis DSM 16080]
MKPFAATAVLLLLAGLVGTPALGFGPPDPSLPDRPKTEEEALQQQKIIQERLAEEQKQREEQQHSLQHSEKPASPRQERNAESPAETTIRYGDIIIHDEP